MHCAHLPMIPVHAVAEALVLALQVETVQVGVMTCRVPPRSLNIECLTKSFIRMLWIMRTKLDIRANEERSSRRFHLQLYILDIPGTWRRSSWTMRHCRCRQCWTWSPSSADSPRTRRRYSRKLFGTFQYIKACRFDLSTWRRYLDI